MPCTGAPLATPDVTTIQTDCNGRSRFRRRLDLELAPAVEGELLGAQLCLQSLGGLKYMGTNSLALQTGIDRQHIV